MSFHIHLDMEPLYTHISYKHVLSLHSVPPPNHTHPPYSYSIPSARSLPVSYLCSRHFENLPVGNADTSFWASLLAIAEDKSRNSVVHSRLSASLLSVPRYKWYRCTWKVLQQQSRSHSLSSCERRKSEYRPLRVTKAGASSPRFSVYAPFAPSCACAYTSFARARTRPGGF